MTFEEKLRTLLLPLVTNVWWDNTPDKVPPGNYILLSRPSGRAGWYVDNTLPDHKHTRVQITGICDRSEDREKLADEIEAVMAAAGFPACEPQGNWHGFSIPGQKKYACLWQFGVWYKPDVP